MKVLLLLTLLFSASFVQAQKVPYNVVFDLTSKDTNDHKMVIRWMNEISKGRPDAKLELVLYGQSLDMIRKDKSNVKEAIDQLTKKTNVSIKVCAAAMKRHGVEASQLLEGVQIVEDGIYEIISKQKKGWGYIKAAH